jgi:hypothetical protein
MPIGNGGIIGPNNIPSLSSAKGVWSIQEAMLAQRAGTWPLPTPDNVDPYFYSVTSLLHGDGTNGGQNNTFLDSSTNNFTITRNGNTTQGSFSPFSQTGWSNYFDGATATRLTMPSNTAFAFGTGAYTVEAWVYLSAHAATQTTVFDCGSATNSLNFSILSTGALSLGVFGVGPTLSSAGGAVALNTWNHVAVVRESTASNATKLYVNGTAVATGTDTGNYSVTTTPAIGGLNSSGFTATGYISNVRLVKGTAVYTANFTPSLTPLTAITNTSLLTCQSNRFIDNSTNAFAITRNGDVSVQPFSPFNPTTPYSTSSIGGSGYFDGSGDYLDIAHNAVLTPAGDFTIEFWAYPLTASGIREWYTKGIGIQFYSNGAAWGLALSSNNSGTYYINATFGTLIANAWQHVVVTRSGNSYVGFVNGVATSLGTTSSAPGTGTDALRIGDLSVSGGYPVFGYMSGVRYVNGTAVYGTSNFTPPTSPPTAVTNTQLLTNFTNGAIFDNAAVADYETVGNAQISTSVKKYGTGSIAFDGTGDYLVTDAPSTQLMTFGTGDFTIEFWAYVNSTVGDPFLFDFRPASTQGLYPTLYFSSGTIRYYTNTGDRITGPSLSTSTWYHIALCRVASQTKLFINGTQVGSTYADTNSYLCGAGRPFIGGDSRTATGNLNGYIDDFRISKGIGRYPYNFTPPTAELPNIGGTVTLTADPYFDYTTLLLPGNGTNGAQNNTFLDSSTNNFTITRNGNTTQGTFSPFSQTGWGSYFDGSGDYLSVSGGVTNAGTGDFTLEFWAYYTGSYANYETIFDSRTSGGGFTNGFNVGLDITTGYWYAGFAVQDLLTTIPAAKNQWTHIAVTRSGTTMRLFVNGTVAGSITTSNNLTSTTNFIGTYYNANNYYFNGYISNFRAVKGTAVYTSNFTPSTTPLTAISGTSLLTCQSNRFIDNSTNAFAITRNGNVSVQAFSPFNPTTAWSASTNGGSGYFDGSGDFLTAPSNAAFGYGTGDFTIEMWIYPTVISGSTPNIFDQRTAQPQVAPTIYINVGQLIYYTNGLNRITGATLVAGQWYHIAVCRASGSTRMFLNGVQTGSTYADANNYINSPVSIFTQGVAGAVYQEGYCGDVRVVKGTALYTTTFTPPTAPLTAISGTSLLLNYTNAGIYDATSKNDLETVGNAQISTTQSKFGGSSMAFDGTGDYLRAPFSAINRINTSGDFTIEFWAYFNSVAQDQRLIAWDNNSTNFVIAIYTNLSGNLVYYLSSTGTTWNIAAATSMGSIAINTWYHVALVRNGSVFTPYINGVAGTTTTSSATLFASTLPLVIGATGNGASFFNGYIDDFRITNGIARYTSNFTPPTTAFLTL